MRMAFDYPALVANLGARIAAYATPAQDGMAEFFAQPYGYPTAALAGLFIAWRLYRRLRKRRFYFVRHGKSLLNAAHIRQSAAGGLSPEGREQARTTAMFLAQFPIQVIYASPYERTAETAAVIRDILKKPLRYSKLLVERRNPSEIIGKSADDPEVRKIVDRIDLSYHADSARYSDEENFTDLKRRARKCLRYLSRAPHSQVCVVTHGIFLRMLLAYMAYGPRLHANEYIKTSFFNPADNANIMVCDYRPWRLFARSRGWEIVTYNMRPPRAAAVQEQKRAADVMPHNPAQKAGA